MTRSFEADDVVVAEEESSNQQYQDIMETRYQPAAATDFPRNSIWLCAPGTHKRQLPQGPLIGRVVVDDPDEGVIVFHIGPWYLERDGLVVYNWAAPVGAAFHSPGSYEHPYARHVLATRTFLNGFNVHTLREEVRLVEEEILDDDCEATPFPGSASLSVPEAPAAPPLLPNVDTASALIDEPAADGSAPLVTSASGDRTAETSDAAQRSGELINEATGGPLIRAATVLTSRLSAPRSTRLHSVLPTIQPDQRHSITLQADESSIIEGPAGSGKTIIASHRAGWLVTPPGPGEEAPVDRVLLVGPNTSYREHVWKVVDDLGAAENVDVVSVDEAMRYVMQQGGLTPPRASQPHRHYVSHQWLLGDVVGKALQQCRRQGLLDGKKRKEQFDVVLEIVRANGRSGDPLTTDEQTVDWLAKVPRLQQAQQDSQYWPLLAFICLNAGFAHEIVGFDHIIVDEAQDVLPLQWRTLALINDGGCWTILGDLDQRHTDFGYLDWKQLWRDLSPKDATVPVHTIDVGYRSTMPIMEYAMRLLPKSHRKLQSVQVDGPEVTVHKAKKGDLPDAVVWEAKRLRLAYPDGTVAIIVVDPGPIEKALIAAQVPFTASAAGADTTNSELRVLRPDGARGLEFDGVVVVEPATFPMNLGHHGQLYTSMTRANKELSVVHAQALPSALQARKKGRG